MPLCSLSFEPIDYYFQLLSDIRFFILEQLDTPKIFCFSKLVKVYLLFLKIILNFTNVLYLFK